MGHYYYFLFILSDAVLRKLLLYSLQTLYFSEQHYRHLSIYMQNTRSIKYKFHACHLVVLYPMTTAGLNECNYRIYNLCTNTVY